MLRGTIKFKCDQCKDTFIGPDLEWCATAYTAPATCPHCHSRHTYPATLTGLLSKRLYKDIWQQLDSQSE